MPTDTFLPLLDITGSVKPEYLHAAVCDWLDRTAVNWDHDSTDKPYTVTPITRLGNDFGVRITTLTDEATTALEVAASTHRSMRLGRTTTRLGDLRAVYQVPWERLSAARANRWLIEFCSPTVFRSGNRSSPLPTPSALLRAPRQAWDSFSPIPLETVDRARINDVWVSDLDLETVPVNLQIGTRRTSGQRAPVDFRAAIGTLSLRCDDPDTAALVSPLFALARFCGVGSFRAKGFGVVEVRTG